MQIKLTTTGRRSGERRTVSIYAWPDGDRLVVVGSRSGSATDPAWVTNLRADPLATVTRGRRGQRVRATEAMGAERERLWRLVTAAFPLYATYQERTRRRIPILVLEPLEDERANGSSTGG